MFANRFTAVLDACVLAGALQRNLLLSLAEADFYRPRWSMAILDETERAIAAILSAKGEAVAASAARKARASIDDAFPDASVVDYAALIGALGTVPDPDDRHVIAAAIKTKASVIVTDNLKDFPPALLNPFDLEARSADAFLADTIDLDPIRAATALKTMRLRFAQPALTAEALILKIEARGLESTADALSGIWHLL